MVIWGPSSFSETSHCINCWKGLWTLWGLFYMNTNLFMKAPPSWAKYLQKAPPIKTITLSIKISTYKFPGDTNVQTLALTIISVFVSIQHLQMLHFCSYLQFQFNTTGFILAFSFPHLDLHSQTVRKPALIAPEPKCSHFSYTTCCCPFAHWLQLSVRPDSSGPPTTFGVF